MAMARKRNGERGSNGGVVRKKRNKRGTDEKENVSREEEMER